MLQKELTSQRGQWIYQQDKWQESHGRVAVFHAHALIMSTIKRHIKILMIFFKNNSKGVSAENIFPILLICTSSFWNAFQREAGDPPLAGSRGVSVPGKTSYFRLVTLRPRFQGWNRENGLKGEQRSISHYTMPENYTPFRRIYLHILI